MTFTRKTILYITLCLLVMGIVLPVAVSAEESVRTDALCSMTVVYRQEELPLTGATFRVYRVAAVSEEGSLMAADAFSSYEMDLTDLDAGDAATLLGYAQLDEIQPDLTLTVDDTGEAVAENLPTGLYLISGDRMNTEAGAYTCSPMVVSLPVQEEDGTWNYLLTVQPKAAFEPRREMLERKVLKVWDDNGAEHLRPQSIEVTLLQDGKAKETVILSGENNWRYSWSELDAGYSWTIVETPVEGYSATHETKGITTVITNTADVPETEPTEPPVEDDPKLPQTGMLWWPVPVLFALGLLFVIAGVIMKRGSRYEA